MEPFGPLQEDLRAGQLASLIHWAHKAADARALKPADIFPSLRDPQEAEKEEIREQWTLRIWEARVKAEQKYKAAQ